VLEYLAPYEFYLEVVAFCLLAALAYGRGLYVRRANGLSIAIAPAISYFLGLTLIYVLMHTYIDYLSQYMFWVHRLQHLGLHHLGAFLMVLGRPHEVLPYSLPPGPRAVARRILYHPVVQWPYRVVQQPAIAGFLFVGLIYFWLLPSIHFDAMLSEWVYRIMNASMVIDGLLFWWLIVNPRGKLDGGFSFGKRVLLLWLIMFPQLALGAYIALSNGVLYDVYAVCGRAWPVSPITDQQLGGLITWIPAGMMSLIGILYCLRLWLHESARTTPSTPTPLRPRTGEST
jgi:putative membrane protein